MSKNPFFLGFRSSDQSMSELGIEPGSRVLGWKLSHQSCQRQLNLSVFAISILLLGRPFFIQMEISSGCTLVEEGKEGPATGKLASR